ncbi:MAG: cell division topological specificity factor MinE [Clostridiales bacterium]|nr:cell division topological specificity factor MinE [Clostridiales bacterium]
MDVFNILWRKNPSKKVAKDRLKLVLIHDRSHESEHVLELMKSELIKTISNYMDIDTDDFEIQITQTPSEDQSGDRVPVLYANIPIKGIHKINEQPGKKKKK